MENNTQSKISTPTAIIIAGVLIMVGIIVAKSPTQPQQKIDTTDKTVTEQAVLAPVTTDEHILGDLATAQVAIIEFSDTECPFCKTFHNALHTAVEKYPGKIAWVYRHFPLDSLHPKARMEARATECAASIGGNTAFWKYLDMIFAETPSNNKLDMDLLPVFAEKIGIDKEKFATCLASDKFDATVQEQYQQGVAAGAQGTPYTIIVTKDGTQYPIEGANETTLNATLKLLIK